MTKVIDFPYFRSVEQAFNEEDPDGKKRAKLLGQIHEMFLNIRDGEEVEVLFVYGVLFLYMENIIESFIEIKPDEVQWQIDAINTFAAAMSLHGDN